MNTRLYTANQQQPAPPPQQPPAPPAPGVNDVYQAVDSILLVAKEAMSQNPEAREELKAQSSEVKSNFKQELVGLAALPQTSEDSRQLALNALAAGMLAGALDGAVLLHADAASQAAKPAAATEQQPDGIGEDIGKAVDKFFEDLQQKLAEAKEKLKTMGADALQSTSRHGKDLGGQLVDESDRLVGAGKLQTQAYMASAFSLGYALGATDAAIVMVANQTPAERP